MKQPDLFRDSGVGCDGWVDIDYTLPIENLDEGGFISQLYKVRDDWLQRLKIVSESKCHDKKCMEKFLEFTRYLVDHQRFDELEGMNIKGSWCLPMDAEMPSDARVDFMYMPTYIAVAWLTLIRQEYSQIADSIDNFDKSLRCGLDFASGRKLSGHGYEATEEMLVAIEYLSLGKAFDFIREYPSYSRKFRYAIIAAKGQIIRQLRDNDGWGMIDEQKAHIALSSLDRASHGLQR